MMHHCCLAPSSTATGGRLRRKHKYPAMQQFFFTMLRRTTSNGSWRARVLNQQWLLVLHYKEGGRSNIIDSCRATGMTSLGEVCNHCEKDLHTCDAWDMYVCCGRPGLRRHFCSRGRLLFGQDLQSPWTFTASSPHKDRTRKKYWETGYRSRPISSHGWVLLGATWYGAHSTSNGGRGGAASTRCARWRTHHLASWRN